MAKNNKRKKLTQMDSELRNEFIRYRCGKDVDERRMTERALDVLEEEGYDFKFHEVNHSRKLSEEELYTDIDSVIKLLKDLKSKGYTTLSQVYTDYDCYHTEVDKYESETKDEYFSRLRDKVCSVEWKLRDADEEKKRKQSEIDRLQKRINEIKSSL